MITPNKKSTDEKGFGHFLLFLLILIIIGVVAAVGLMVYKKNQGPLASLPGCDTTKQLLSESPVRETDISTIIPLGNIAPPGHVVPTYHMYYNYIHTGGSLNPVPMRTALYVPADMTVYKMMKMDNADHDPAYDAYRIDFGICKQVSGYFILVQELNDKLAAAMKPPYDETQESDTGAGKKSHNFIKEVNVKLTKGELLGYAGGKPGYPDGLDFAIIDKRQPKATVANVARWDDDLYYACTLDYYPSQLSESLYAKIGGYDGKKTGSHDCGQVYQDVAGTAQGVWMAKDAGPEAKWYNIGDTLALVHSNFDRQVDVVSFGNKASRIGINTSRTLVFSPSTSGRVNLDFNQVKPDGNLYCYDVANSLDGSDGKAVLLMQMTDSTSLRIGPANASCGSGPWKFGQYIDYVR